MNNSVEASTIGVHGSSQSYHTSSLAGNRHHNDDITIVVLTEPISLALLSVTSNTDNPNDMRLQQDKGVRYSAQSYEPIPP